MLKFIFFNLTSWLKYIRYFFRIRYIKKKISMSINLIFFFILKHFMKNFFIQTKRAILTMLIMPISTKMHRPDAHFLVVVHPNDFRMKGFPTCFVRALKV